MIRPIKNILIVTFIACLATSCTPLKTQPKAIDISYGGETKDGLRSIATLADGGYILAGWRDQTKPGHVGIGHIINLAPDGTHRWDKDIVTNSENRVSNIIERKDGSLVIVVEEYPVPQDLGQVVIMELSAKGDIQKQHSIGGDGPDLIEVMRPTPDGGYIFGGESAKIEGGDYQGWMGKLSSDFEIEWQHHLGETNSPDVFQDITLLKDGSVIGVGMLTEHSTDPQNPARPWMVKIDPAGDLQWSKIIDSKNLFALRGVSVTPKGDLAVAGYTRQWDIKEYNSWVGLISDKGDVIWDKELPNPGFDQLIALEPTTDNRFIAVGAVKSQETGFDLKLVSFDAKGRDITSHIHQKPGRQFGRAIRPLSGNSVAIGGFETTDGPMGQELWFFKSDLNALTSSQSTSP